MRTCRLSPDRGATISVAITAITTMPITIAKRAKPSRARRSAAMYRHVISDRHRSVSAWREPYDCKIAATERSWLIAFREGSKGFRIGESDVENDDRECSRARYARR